VARLRGSSFRSFPRSQKRKTSWDIGPETTGNGGGQSVSSTIAQLAGVGSQVVADGPTLVRTRGEIVGYLSTATAKHDGFHGAFGIAVATSAAFTAGVASVPTPLSEEDWDGWLYHRYVAVHSAGPIVDAAVSLQSDAVHNVGAAFRFEVDSKAMRKLTIGQTMYACIEMVITGTAVMRWFFNCRTLVKLP